MQLKKLIKHYVMSLEYMIADCNDMYLSDVRKLDNAFWKLRNAFNLEEK